MRWQIVSILASDCLVTDSVGRRLEQRQTHSEVTLGSAPMQISMLCRHWCNGGMFGDGGVMTGEDEASDAAISLSSSRIGDCSGGSAGNSNAVDLVDFALGRGPRLWRWVSNTQSS